MRWLVTGAGGMLGTDAARLLEERGHEVLKAERANLDITDPDAVRSAVAGVDVVFNCAAWTAVDDAETRESEAFAVNAVGPSGLARAVRDEGARLVHVSTDYVFDGRASTPYTNDAALRPRSAYGRTKAAGEWAVRAELPDDHLVVRTAWLYAAAAGCFPRTIARLARERRTVSVVTDQVGQPTWTRDVADLVERLVVGGVPAGTYHATSSGEASWFEFAQAVCEAAGLAPGVVKPTTTAEFPRPAERPRYSVLSHETVLAAGASPIGHWLDRWRSAAAEVLQ